MLVAFLAALVVVNITHLWVQDRRDKRTHEERLAHRLELAGLIGKLDSLARTHTEQLLEMQEGHRREVQMFCQRIQAPEVAVVQHQQQTVPDEDGSPLTDLESAEDQAERLAALEFIERVENGGLVS